MLRWILLVLATTMAPAAARPEPAPARIVAIGDLHGDHDAWRAIARAAGLTDGSGRWAGGQTVLVQLGDKNIESVQDLMFTLNSAKPHQTVTAVVLRGGKRVELKVTYQERGGGGGQSPHGQATGSPEAQGKAPAAPAPGAPAKPTHP